MPFACYMDKFLKNDGKNLQLILSTALRLYTQSFSDYHCTRTIVKGKISSKFCDLSSLQNFYCIFAPPLRIKLRFNLLLVWPYAIIDQIFLDYLTLA